ncbi:MAG: DUF1015 domain-containing protein [Elusimicrobia bacterium]|nr:DUF1015 domain-containing protein [Elusimicrobiota bacterium]
MKTNFKNFKGILFNSSDLASCIAPPYDVFEYGDDTDKMLRSNPSNIVHIQKPLGTGDEKYKNAAEALKKYLDDKILLEDSKPGVYIIKQTWEGGSRTGFIASVRLDDTLKRIKPHEHTKTAPISDRFKLTAATNLNIGCIFSVFDDEKGIVRDILKNNSKEPRYSFKFPEDIDVKVYFSDDETILSSIEDKTLYIADGHHRYKTMIKYRDMKRAEKAPGDAYEYTMMFLVPDNECTILPYHRAVNAGEANIPSDFDEKLKKDFTITSSAKLAIPEKGTIGLLDKSGYRILQPLKSDTRIETAVLQEKVIAPHLNISIEDIKTSESITFIPGDISLETIQDKVDTGEYLLAFILPPPEFRHVSDAADAGEVMPPKSTYFYPKIPTGIVVRKCS